MTPHNYEIVDCGAFCEVIFFCISPKNLLRDFFDSLAIYRLFPRNLSRYDMEDVSKPKMTWGFPGILYDGQKGSRLKVTERYLSKVISTSK